MSEKLEIISAHQSLEYRMAVFGFADKENLLPTQRHLLVLAGIATKQLIGYHFGVEFYVRPNDRRFATTAIVASAEKPTKKYISQIDDALRTYHENPVGRLHAPVWNSHYVGKYTPDMASTIINEDMSAEMSKLDTPKRIPNHIRLMHYPVSSNGSIEF